MVLQQRLTEKKSPLDLAEKTSEDVAEFLEKVEQCGNFTQQAFTSERSTAFMPTNDPLV